MKQEQLDEMDRSVDELKNNKCLQQAWKKVKAAAERKLQKEDQESAPEASKDRQD